MRFYVQNYNFLIPGVKMFTVRPKKKITNLGLKS